MLQIKYCFGQVFLSIFYAVLLSWHQNLKLQIAHRLILKIKWKVWPGKYLTLPHLNTLPHLCLENVKHTQIRQKNSQTKLSKKLTAACNILIPSKPHRFISFWRRISMKSFSFFNDYVKLSLFSLASFCGLHFSSQSFTRNWIIKKLFEGNPCFQPRKR